MGLLGGLHRRLESIRVMIPRPPWWEWCSGLAFIVVVLLLMLAAKWVLL